MPQVRWGTVPTGDSPRTPMASIAKRPDGQWRARYRDGAGKEHARHFRRRTEAQQWLDQEITSSRPVPGLRREPPRSPLKSGARSGWTDTGLASRPPCEWPRCTLPRSSPRSGRVGWTRSDPPTSRAGSWSCRASTPILTFTHCTRGLPRCLQMLSTMEHASAKTTLDTYGHLWPDSDETTRAAISGDDDPFSKSCGQSAASRVLSLSVRPCQRRIQSRRRSRARTRAGAGGAAQHRCPRASTRSRSRSGQV